MNELEAMEAREIMEVMEENIDQMEAIEAMEERQTSAHGEDGRICLKGYQAEVVKALKELRPEGGVFMIIGSYADWNKAYEVMARQHKAEIIIMDEAHLVDGRVIHDVHYAHVDSAYEDELARVDRLLERVNGPITADELNGILPRKRDRSKFVAPDARKGWQTCHGPAQRRSSNRTKDWRTWNSGPRR